MELGQYLVYTNKKKTKDKKQRGLMNRPLENMKYFILPVTI
jgi:hypothetical protein